MTKIAAPLVLVGVLTSGTMADTKKPPLMAKLLLCFASVSPVAIRATDHSMAPVVRFGEWASGDVNAAIAEGSLCLIYFTDGSELIRWIRTEGDYYILIPENTLFPALRVERAAVKATVQVKHILADSNPFS